MKVNRREKIVGIKAGGDGDVEIFLFYERICYYFLNFLLF